jgi:tetratricopeptide (TPR) repeat protein
MGIESRQDTASTTWATKVSHPVRQYLESAGLDVSEFPRLKILIEVDYFFDRVYWVRIPLRLPANPGWTHEFIFRVVRTMELPREDLSGHQKFVELECTISEEPIPFEELHLSTYFLPEFMECPTCRHRFPSNTKIINQKQVEIHCAQCLNQWVLNVEPKATEKAEIRILTDQYFVEPGKLTKWIESASSPQDKSQPMIFKSFFSVIFTKEISSEASVIFRNSPNFLRSRHDSNTSQFADFIKSLFNSWAFSSLRIYLSERKSGLEETDICRKSQLKNQDPGSLKDSEEFEMMRLAPTVVSVKSSEPFFASFQGVDSSKPQEFHKNSSNQKAAVFAFAGAAFVFLTIISYFFFERSHRIQKESADQVLEMAPRQLAKNLSTNSVDDRIISDSQSVKNSKENEKLLVKQTELLAQEIPADFEKPNMILEESAQPPVAVKAVNVAKEKPRSAENAIIEKGSREHKQKVDNDKTMVVDPRSTLVEAGFRQGVLHLKLQQAKEAAEEFERVIEIDPNHLESHRNLGLAYIYDRRFEEAIKILEKYLTFKDSKADRVSIEELISTLKERAQMKQAR